MSSIVNGAVYRITNVKVPGSSLELEGGSPTNGTVAQIWATNKNSAMYYNQVWVVKRMAGAIPNKPDPYYLCNARSGSMSSLNPILFCTVLTTGQPTWISIAAWRLTATRFRDGNGAMTTQPKPTSIGSSGSLPREITLSRENPSLSLCLSLCLFFLGHRLSNYTSFQHCQLQVQHSCGPAVRQFSQRVSTPQQEPHFSK